MLILGLLRKLDRSLLMSQDLLLLLLDELVFFLKLTKCLLELLFHVTHILVLALLQLQELGLNTPSKTFYTNLTLPASALTCYSAHRSFSCCSSLSICSMVSCAQSNSVVLLIE